MNLLKVFKKYFIEVTSNYFRKTMVNEIVFFSLKKPVTFSYYRLYLLTTIIDYEILNVNLIIVVVKTLF